MSDLRDSFNKSKYILDNFERALSEGWIEVFYQPIIRTSNGKVCGEEALVRWDDPLLGMLNPIDFVPALEAVNQIHRVDLYVLEQVLDKMKEQRRRGLFIVPTSINLSQPDFYACDIVEEISSRVEKANISRHMIAIEVSESTLSFTDDFVISQMEQFKELGFQVWMDDYGSGNFSPALLQRFHFDLLKINIFFIKQILDSESARIIVTELIRMATSLETETVAEGVEYKAQIDFLNEVGCSQMQGFYFLKPVSKLAVFKRYDEGSSIGFENPEESAYYTAIGKINLYDLEFTKDNTEGLDNYFDTIPTAIVEAGVGSIRILRSNKSYKKFLHVNGQSNIIDDEIDINGGTVGFGPHTISSIRKCGSTGKRIVIDDRLKNGKNIQLLLHRIATNPVKKVAAIAIVVLSTADKRISSDDLTYNYIARTLAEDYINVFYIDMDTDEFVEFNPDGANRNVSVSRRGKDFFTKSARGYFSTIYEDDKEILKASFVKENIEEALNAGGMYSITYRRIIDDKPVYVNLKAVRVRTEGNFILVGINNVDAQMKEREIIEKVKEERATYSRIMALSGDFISIYSVNPEDDSYVCYSSSEEYGTLDIQTSGDDFYRDSTENAKRVIHPDDFDSFSNAFHKKTILKAIKDTGIFTIKYRLFINGEPRHICLKAAMIKSKSSDEYQLVVGVLDVENQVIREQEYASTLLEAEDKATKDQLTGVKNKRAYVSMEEELNQKIKGNYKPKFAVVVFDLNGLKQINDTLGHAAGDEFIKDGCTIICDTFSRSPVFRVGGDEFVAIVTGKDYDLLDVRLDKIQKINKRNLKDKKVTIAVGAAKIDGDSTVLEVFERADAAMYENKRAMKQQLDN